MFSSLIATSLSDSTSVPPHSQYLRLRKGLVITRIDNTKASFPNFAFDLVFVLNKNILGKLRYFSSIETGKYWKVTDLHFA